MYRLGNSLKLTGLDLETPTIAQLTIILSIHDRLNGLKLGRRPEGLVAEVFAQRRQQEGLLRVAVHLQLITFSV